MFTVLQTVDEDLSYLERIGRENSDLFAMSFTKLLRFTMD